MSSDEDAAIVSRVQIRKNPKDFIHYVPPKGIDITFHPVDPTETKPNAPRLYDAIITGSPSHPDTPIEPRQINDLLSSWRSLVSDRVEIQHRQPIKHKITTIVSRDHVRKDKVIKERIDKLPANKKWKDEDGNDVAEISGEARELR
jgi:hypothetical protein